MKTAPLICLHLAIAVSYVVRPVSTGEQLPCGDNEVPVLCEPCTSYCNEEPRFCILVCKEGNFCQCKSGFLRVSRDNSTCVPEEECPSVTKPKCRTILIKH